MTDILDYILASPGRGRRLTEEQQAACRSFVQAVGFDRDFDDLVGVLAGLSVMFNRRRQIPEMKTFERIRHVAAGVSREWQRHA